MAYLSSPISITGTQTALSSTSWTSATALNTANTLSVTGYNTVTIGVVTTSTFTGGVITFEASPDGSNWFTLACARIDQFGVDTTYTFIASTIRGWSTSVDGFTSFRVRLSTVIAGSGTATVLVTGQTMAVEPIVNAGVSMVPGTINGLSAFHLVSAATTNATNIKASAGQVYGWYIYNSNAAARKITFHNSASAPTAGAGVFFSIMIPPTSGANVEYTNGISFSAGIGITTTTGLADNDSAAVALNDLIINIFYK
jgi:hypothetical protein